MSADDRTVEPDRSPQQRPATRALIAAACTTAAALLAILLDLTPLLRGPAPYPPDWQWTIREAGVSFRGLASVLAWGIGLIGLLCASTSIATRRWPRASVAIGLPIAIALSFGLQISLLKMENPRSATDLLLLRTMDPSFGSHFTVGMQIEPENVHKFLERYPSLLPRLPVHARTHPPGPALLFSGFKASMVADPSLLGRFVELARKLDVAPGFIEDDQARLHFAAAFCGAYTLILLGNLACASVFLLAWSLGMRASHALRLAIIWAFVPAFSLFLALTDQVVLLTTTSFSALLAAAIRTPQRPAAHLLAVLAGLAGGAGLHFSYGAGVFLGFAALVVAAGMWQRIDEDRRGAAIAFMLASASVLIATFAPLRGYDPIQSAVAALSLHAEEFTASRAYGTWLVYNLWDLALFVGCPVLVLLGGRVYADLRSRAESTPRRAAARWLPIATTAAVLVLDLSGTVRGEAGRIWLPIMPYLVIASLIQPANMEAEPRTASDPDALGPTLRGATIVALLLLTCTVVLRSRWHL